MDIVVLGSGGWGTALSLLLCKNGHTVTLWSHSREKAEALRTIGKNPSLSGVPLLPALQISGDIACIKKANVLVFASPSYALRDTARLAAPYVSADAGLVSATKGVERDTGLRMSQILQQELPGHSVAVLSGPSHAEEVARDIPTGCVIASEDKAFAEQVQDLLMNPSFRVYTSGDTVGVELCAAAKNVIALGAGLCDGLHCGDNSKALLMTRSMVEIGALLHAAGGQHATITGLAGIGDIIVTCMSQHSRNHRAGCLLGQGLSVEETLRQVGAVVEGYYAARSVTELAEKLHVSMPICRCIYDILYEGRDAATTLRGLMLRDRRCEFRG